MKHTYILFFFLCSVMGYSQNPNDCTDAILLCGDTSFGISPSGIGVNEFAQAGNPVPTCFSFQTNQAWFRVEIQTTGTFSFALTPDTAQADYDFAVFGPVVDCDNLGTAIRCSSTNPRDAGVTGETGLNSVETDFIEGPGANGNGFLQELTVNAGEVYYVIVALAVGTGGFSISTGGTADLPPAPVANPLMDLEVCDNAGAQDGFREFDFSSLNSDVLLGQTNTTVTYHESLNDANIGINAITFPYTNITNPQDIYVRVIRNDSDCTDFTDFTILVDDPNIDTDIDPFIICSDNATEPFDYNTVIDSILPNASSFNVTYHLTQMDAQDGLNAQGSMFTATTTEEFYFIRVVDPTGLSCDYVLNTSIFVANPPAIAIPVDLFLCDDDFDGFLNVALTDQNNEILNGLDPLLHQVTFYESAADRTAGQNALNSSFTTTQNPQRIYVRVTETSTSCFSDVDYQITIRPRPVLQSQDDIIVCVDAVVPTTISVAAGFDFYEWNTGEMGATTNSIDINQPGDYTVTVTNNFGCESSLTITALPSDVATIDDIITQDFRNGDNTAQFIVSGPGDYEFSVDNGPFQDSNFFNGLYKGFHTVRIRDKNGCGTITEEFAVLDYQRFFTPNGDGFHDYWTLDGLTDYPDAIIFIYDRYGKLLHQMAPDGIGWDGTFINAPMPSSTYWFTLKIEGKPLVKGYFALKR
ncbi:T9SS type B sorting domain-containing protein [Nonlabens ulvanivorans]|uniref:T9SS type B sorting domain-containing protein n=1 Tax=Nonlabens ulvanivorans TaxID=906888 RepID=UPI0037C95F12